MSQFVFEGVRYFISETLPPNQREQLSKILDARGAEPVASVTDPKLTHLIASSIALEDFVEAVPEDSPAHVVTPLWVERSAVLGALQDPAFYSADPAFLFSGVIAAATDLSQSDCELLSAAISALGGQWRTTLTRDVTHLFALAPGSAKYDTAMHFKDKTGMRVLVPHWFDDTVRLGIRDLPTRNYEWPEPRVFQQRPEGRTPQEDAEYEPPSERMMLYSTSSMPNDEQHKVKPAARNVWNGKRILLGLSLDLSDQQRKALAVDIRRQGGEVVELSSLRSASQVERARDEMDKLEEADVFVTRYRSGPAYAKAYKLRLTIGTLAWLWYVRATGTLTRPADQLLHYPIPDKPAEGFDKEVITVTNYTGKDREYLKKLITLMGGEFTPTMAAERNTVVVAAYLHGTKTDKATSWSIPIVNHTWVEDCFVQWRRLTPAREKYIKFPPGVDFSVVLAERGLGRISWDPAQLEEMFRIAEADIEADGEAPQSSAKRVRASASPGKKKSPKKAKNHRLDDEDLPAGTAASAVEVEDVVAMEDRDVSLGGHMDIDHDFADLEDAEKTVDSERMDVDDDPGPSKRPPLSKKGPPSKRAAREDASPKDTKRRLVRRYTPRNTDEEGEERNPDTTTTSAIKAPPRTYGSAKSRRSKAEAARVESPVSSPSPVKKSSSTRPPLVIEDDVDMDGPSEVQVHLKNGKVKKGPPGVRVTKVKPSESRKPSILDRLEMSDSSSTDEEDMRSVLGDLVKNGRSSRAGAAPTGQTPQKLDSVLVPTVDSVYSSPTKKGGKADALGSANAAAPKSTRAAAEAPAPAAKKQARAPVPSESSASTLPAAPHKTARKTKAAPIEVPEAFDAPEAGPSGLSTPGSPSKTGRTPSRRSAATKATQKLHEVIMPDVLSYQKELKKGAVRPAHELEKAAGSKGKARAGEPADAEPRAKGKKRQSIGSGDEEDAVQEERPEKKKRKAADAELPVQEKTKGKKRGAAGRKSTTEPSQEAESQQPVSRKKPVVAAADKETARSETKAVRVMTTQLTLGDDVVRRLTKLGVKFVTKPTECTHLIVRSVVRTEKFLCAMAAAPYVLSEQWAIMSAAGKKLLPEEKYLVEDAATEKKYRFNLAEALKRAKKNAGKLFAGKTFYVTGKVPVESKLLKNVVTANGGQLSTQTPTVRMLNGHDDRFVISCPDDRSIWRPLVEHGHSIYTQELILTSALRQEIDFDDTAFQVSVSS